MKKHVINNVYVKTHGCSTNFADGEVIVGCLATAGYKVVNNMEDADAVIYNTCAVKTPTENRMISLLKKVPKGKKLIVTGCLPLINFERLNKEITFDAAMGPAPGATIINALKRVSRGEKIFNLRSDSKPDCLLPRVFLNKVTSIVPISYGCLGSCSYCCVRYARGKLRSYTIPEILTRIKRDLDIGVKEIWLTSQDTGAYGVDIGEDLVTLLRSVVDLKGKFFVRVGMMNPNHAIENVDNLVEAYGNPKIYKFIHIPVQSGDDNVLKMMNRFYTVQEFRNVVNAFRNEIPKISLATDIICGFPGEDDNAFNNSIQLLKEIKPDVLNISKFFVRPNTLAKNLRGIPAQKIKKRSIQVSMLHRKISLEKNKKWLHWEGQVLINKRKNGKWTGRNFAYKPITLETEKEDLLGEYEVVRITGVKPTHLKAEIIA